MTERQNEDTGKADRRQRRAEIEEYLPENSSTATTTAVSSARCHPGCSPAIFVVASKLVDL